jgi:hypothetical protein
MCRIDLVVIIERLYLKSVRGPPFLIPTAANILLMQPIPILNLVS